MSDTPNPGQGWRLLKEGEVIEPNDEWFNSDRWQRVAEWRVGGPQCAATTYRRRIDDGWIKLSERLPDKFPCEVFTKQGRRYFASKSPGSATGYECISDVCYGWVSRDEITHWKPLTLSPPPAPEVDEQRRADEKAFVNWWWIGPEQRNPLVNLNSIYTTAETVWHAACAYVRKQEDMKKECP